jgi:hypothetical protein
MFVQLSGVADHFNYMRSALQVGLGRRGFNG